jgi:uncharacterized protein (TIGR02145 family)
MRNLIKTLFAVLIITAINACTLQEAPDPPTGGGAITITAQTVQKQDVTNVPGTKTTLSGVETHWKGVDDYDGNADKIGIFSPQARTTDGGSDPIKNAEFTAQTSAKSSSFNGSMYWGNNEPHNFYAYYPRNPGFSGERTEVPISLASAQSQSAAGNTDHIGALDYMVATPLTVARGGAVNLTFNHVFAMIEFQIKGSGNLTQVSLNGADPLACAGTIDLTQTPGDGAYTVTTSSTSKYVTVTLGTAAPLSSETATSVYMMILPGEQSENLQIALKIDGNWKEMSKTQPTGGFVRGKKYVVELNTGGMSANVLTDSRDENTYSYKTIGTQVWMTENLAYLPSVVGPGTGSNSTAYYYVYGYDGTDVDAAKATSNYTTYGVLYNWPAAMSGAASSSADPSGVQGICPTGWHLPSHAEWTTLTTYLGGESVAGGKMKEAGESHWTNPNTGATNESGFTALPGGYRYNYGKFDVIGILGSWWSSTEFSTGYAWYRSLYYYSSHVGRYYANKANGFSVRCLRD